MEGFYKFCVCRGEGGGQILPIIGGVRCPDYVNPQRGCPNFAGENEKPPPQNIF